MLRSVFVAEFRRQLLSPLMLFACALIAFVAFNDMHITSPTASGLISIGRVAHNAPLVVAELLSALAVPVSFLVALFVGPCVQRDFANRSYPFFFSSPVSKFQYLGGRFFGALAAILLFPLAALLGMAVAWSGLPTSFLGEARAFGLLQAIVLALPTLLFFAALFFSIATLSRRTLPTYLAAVAVMIAGFVVQGMARELIVRGDVSGGAIRWLLLLADSTGRSSLAADTLGWTAVQRSHRLIALSAPLLLNRILWTAAAALLFAWTYRRFTIAEPVAAQSKRLKQSKASTTPRMALADLPRFDTHGPWPWRMKAQAYFRLSWTELRWAASHLAFLVLAAAMILQLWSNFVANVHAAGILARTGFLLNEGLAGVDGPAVILTLFFSGVLVWREHEWREDAISHALPLSNAFYLGSKFTALLALQTLYAALIMGVGLFAQLVVFGVSDIRPALYLKAILGIHLLGWMQVAAAMFFLQVLAPGKVWGFALCAAGILWALLSPAFGLRSELFRFSSVPSYVYSEMNGFGPFGKPILIDRILWTVLALGLFRLALLAWPRGYRTGPAIALRNVVDGLKKHAVWFAALAVAAGTCVVMAVSATGFGSAPTEADLKAIYEARTKSFERIPQPSITTVELQVDLHPRQGAAEIAGSYLLTNTTPSALDTLLITLLPTYLREPPFFELDRKSRIAAADAQIGTTILVLSEQLQVGESVTLGFKIHLHQPSPSARSNRLALVENGTVLDNFVGNVSFFPLLGYRRELEIQDPEIRARNGLDPSSSTLIGLHDPTAQAQASRSWISFAATISTDADQLALTTGTLVDAWTQDGRRFTRYVSDGTMANEFAIVSGRYELARELSHGITLEVYYHPGHAANVPRILAGLKAELDYGLEHFGPYPLQELRVVEVPTYGVVDGTALSKPGLILWNETGGFVDAPAKEGVVDPVFSTAAHELSHQWWGHQLRPAAFVEGAITLNETLAQYSRLRALHQTYDEATVARFLVQERQAFVVLRGRSTQEEHPLLTTTEPFVAYHKGSLVMEALSREFSPEAVDRALRDLLDRYGLMGPPYPTTLDLMSALRREFPTSADSKLHEWFETTDFDAEKILNPGEEPTL